MFTGLIEETGNVREIYTQTEGGSIKIHCRRVLENTKIGDSISVNGICLTVIALGKNDFTAEVMVETLKRTSLKDLKPHSLVNLERALTLNTPLGGHIVSGHIDGTGVIEHIEDQGVAIIMTIATATDGMVEKGSIALDGISLTLAKVEENYFTVSLLPHTVASTNLRTKRIGDKVNLERDIIGKYVQHFLEKREKKEGITEDLLRDNGFF